MPVNYQDGKIYKIVNSVDNTVYVGSTAQKYLSHRMTTHRARAKCADQTTPLYCAMRQHGTDAFRVLLIHKFPCNSKAELEAEEYKVLNAVIAGDTPVYNMRINGKLKCSEATKAKMAQENNYRFNYGCIRHAIQGTKENWIFTWMAKGRQIIKGFSVKKYGYWQAKQMAEAVRKQIYPEWEKPAEEETIENLLAIELD